MTTRFFFTKQSEVDFGIVPYLEFKEMIRILNFYLCKFETFCVSMNYYYYYYYYYYYLNDTLLNIRRAFRNTYMLTAQISSSDRRHYEVPVSRACSFPQPYFLYCLGSAVEHNAFSHSTQANRRTADPVRAYWEWRYSPLDVSQL